MRLQYLKLENITSLKGKHLIDFTEISKQSDLFAITGPTGSGKSTILMAVAMALYGQNHKGLNAADLITTHMPYGKIEVQFILNGKTYRVYWSCQALKKDGTPRKTPVIQRLCYENDQEIDLKAEQIIGLSWDQFTKVIILNQGQFSEFLTSTFHKRKEILEKLMGHGHLELLGKNLRSKLAQLNQEIEALEGQSEFAQFISEEKYLELKNTLEIYNIEFKYVEKLSEQFKKIDKNISEDIKLEEKTKEILQTKKQKLIDQQKIHQDLDRTTDALKVKDQDFVKIQALYKEQKPILKEAIKHQKEIDQITYREKEVEQYKKQDLLLLEQKKGKIYELEGELKGIKKQIDQFKNENEINDEYELTSLKEELSETLNTISNLLITLDQLKTNDIDLKEVENNGNKAKDRMIEMIKNQIINHNSLLDISEIKNEKIITTIDRLITQNEFGQIPQYIQLIVSYLDQYLEKIKKHNLLTSQYELEQKSYGQQYEELKKNKHVYKEKKETIEEELRILITSLEEQNLELQEQKKIHRKWELLRLAYNDLKDLKGPSLDNTPCPLCASKPISWEEVFAPFHNEANQDLQKLNIIEEKVNLQKEKKEKLQLQLGHNQQTLKELETKIDEIQKNIRNTRDKINSHLMEKIDFTEEQLTMTLRKNQDILGSLTHYLEQRDDLVSRWIGLDQRRKQGQKAIEEGLEKLKAKPIPESNEKIDFEGLSNYLKEAKDKSSKSLESTESRLKSLQQCKLLQEKYGALTLSSQHLNNDIEEINKSIQSKVEQQNHLARELTKLINLATINHYPKDPEIVLENLEAEIEKLRAHREAAAKEKREVETLFHQCTQQINNLIEREQEYEKLHLHYLHEINQQLSLIESINLQRTSDKELPLDILETHLGKLFLLPLDQWSERIHRFVQRKWINLELDEYNLQQNFYIDFIQSQGQNTDHYYIQLKEKSAALMSEIGIYDDQQKKISYLNAKISEVKKQKNQFEVLDHYIGKDRFRDYALTILENTLIEMANHEIESLADGRYELLHARAGKRSEFMVKDNWHGGIERKVSTLSGGETFLLSLGLAMGLSDITRGQTEIESFFIDEGFGTLDDESIGQVLDCLMAIQSRGKQIGLISHVTSLTSQIPIRLEVSKNNFGESSLAIQ